MADLFCAQQDKLISSWHTHRPYILLLGLAIVIVHGLADKEHWTAHASAWVHNIALWESLWESDNFHGGISSPSRRCSTSKAHTNSAFGMNEDCFSLENRNVLSMIVQGKPDSSTCQCTLIASVGLPVLIRTQVTKASIFLQWKLLIWHTDYMLQCCYKLPQEWTEWNPLIVRLNETRESNCCCRYAAILGTPTKYAWNSETALEQGFWPLSSSHTLAD